jgi:organic radical activating enzyme
MKIPGLISGGVIPTYACSSACAHCLYACSPKRDKAYMDRESADRCFKTVKRLGCRSMHVGGGEPFLQPEKLFTVLESARDARMPIDYIETNSSWCTSPERMQHILPEIKARGVDRLLLSISPFHNEYIPLRKVLNLMEACREHGIGFFAWTQEMLEDVRALDHDTTHTLEEYEQRYGSGYVPQAMARYGVVPGGTAMRTLEAFVTKQPLEKILSSPSPCRRLTGTTHFHVDLYGNYVPHLCPGLSIRLDDLPGELTDTDYPILNALDQEGVRGLYKLASAKYGFKPDPAGYSMACELCHAVRRYLAVEKQLDSRELQPVEFYADNA